MSAAPKPGPPTVATTEATLRSVNIKDMAVSEMAQRDLREPFVDDILADWHPEQVGYLDVSLRDGKYWIVDGQHRHAALTRKFPDGALIMVRVYTGLSEQDEAELFLKLNHKLNVSAMDKFDVSVVAGRAVETDVNRIVKSHNMVVGRNDKPGHLQAVGTLVRIYVDHGPKVLDRTLGVLIPSFGDTNLFAGLLSGMGSVLARYPEIDEERLVSKLSTLRGGMSAVRTRSEVLHKQTGRPKTQCVASVIVDIYNSGKGGKKLPTWFK